MRKPIFVLITFLLLLTSCSTSNPASTPTIGSIKITDTDLSGSVKRDAFCYRGPDPRFGIATELKKDVQISIVGASEEGDFVVINDPTSIDKICWANFHDIVINLEELIAEFMKLGLGNPDPSDNDNDMASLSPILVGYYCPSPDKSDKAMAEADSGEGPPTLTADQVLHEVCSGWICHNSATIDDYYTGCGELVFPAYYIQSEDCADNSACVTRTPPPVEFIACTPTPTQLAPIILDLVLCWNGPGPGYEVISSLESNTPVQVLGTGFGGDHVVITNPTYNRPCWVKETDIELNGLNLAGLPIFGIPEQDNSPDSPGSSDSPDSPDSPEMGCLVSSSPSVAPKCIKPCPDPVAYPNTCEP